MLTKMHLAEDLHIELPESARYAARYGWRGRFPVVKRPYAAGKLAASCLLGLPAALLAHAVAFGHGHLVGGSLHQTVIVTGVLFAVGSALLAAFGAVHQDSRWKPSSATTAAAAAGWLTGIELLEPSHAIPVIVCILAVAAATFAVGVLVRAFTTAAVAVALALSHRLTEATARAHKFREHRVRIRRYGVWEFRLFSRPPPALS